MFAWGFGGLAASAACAFILILQTGFPTRFSETVLAFDAAKSEAMTENRITQSVTLDDAVNGRFPRLGAPDPAPVALMVWGDSHARSILPALDDLGNERNLAILTAWHSSTAPVLDYVPTDKFSLQSAAPVFNRAVLDHIAQHEIPAVLLAARWSGHFEAHANPTQTGNGPSFANQLIETVRAIHAAGAQPYILMEVPNHHALFPRLSSPMRFSTPT
jgi:hypothetical protein